MRAAQARFVEDMGEHMLGWGLPRTTGRVYAYLLLRTEPVSLDDITRDLGVAKSGASVATRQLVRFGLARGVAERGSRRLLFTGLRTVEAIFAARTAQSEDLVERLREGAKVASAHEAREGLNSMAGELESIIRQFRAQFTRARERMRA